MLFHVYSYQTNNELNSAHISELINFNINGDINNSYTRTRFQWRSIFIII